MPDPKAIAEAKRNIEESERAILRLGSDRSDPENNILRIRLVQQLRQALEEYYALLSGEPRKRAAEDFAT